jgi:hypothetical protein
LSIFDQAQKKFKIWISKLNIQNSPS